MKITKAGQESLMEAVEAVFVPTPLMQKHKAAFWYSWNQGPSRSTDKITLAAIDNELKSTAVQKFWSIPGFREWFLNEQEFYQKAEYAANVAIETILEVLTSDTARAQDRLKAAQMAIDIMGKMKNKTQEVGSGNPQIDALTPEELYRKYGNLETINAPQKEEN